MNPRYCSYCRNGIPICFNNDNPSASVRAVVVTGAGDKAFSAGGDVRALYTEFTGGQDVRRYFEVEYALDHRIHTYPKTIVALIDGIVMGGGMGLAQGARVRRTLAAETKSWFRNAHNSTARRCLGERLSSARSISGATRVHKSASGGNAWRGLPEIHCHSHRRPPMRFRQATAVTWNSQPARTVFFRSLRARRARTRNTARVTSPAWSTLPVRRSANE